MRTESRKRIDRRLVALSTLTLAVMMAAAPAEARRLRIGGFKPSSAPAAAPALSKSGTTVIVVPGAAGARASAQEGSPAQPREQFTRGEQFLRARNEPPPVARVEVPTGPRSAVPVLGASAQALPAPTGFATLN